MPATGADAAADLELRRFLFLSLRFVLLLFLYDNGRRCAEIDIVER